MWCIVFDDQPQARIESRPDEPPERPQRLLELLRDLGYKARIVYLDAPETTPPPTET